MLLRYLQAERTEEVPLKKYSLILIVIALLHILCACGGDRGEAAVPSGTAAVPNESIQDTFSEEATQPSHEHCFSDATCTAPATCACGATEGEPLGHSFSQATCTAPATCVCGATEGTPLGHSFSQATCTAPATCACGATEGLGSQLLPDHLHSPRDLCLRRCKRDCPGASV